MVMITQGASCRETIISNVRGILIAALLDVRQKDKNIARAGILDIGKEIQYESVRIPYDVEAVLRDIRSV